MSDDQKTEAAGTESSLITDHDESSAAEGKQRAHLPSPYSVLIGRSIIAAMS